MYVDEDREYIDPKEEAKNRKEIYRIERRMDKMEKERRTTIAYNSTLKEKQAKKEKVHSDSEFNKGVRAAIDAIKYVRCGTSAEAIGINKALKELARLFPNCI